MGYQDLKLLKRPKGTTHARIVTDQGKKAKCPIKDFEVFEGVEGETSKGEKHAQARRQRQNDSLLDEETSIRPGGYWYIRSCD